MSDLQHTLIVGMTQSGKTHFVLALLRNCHVACRFIFDPLFGQKSFAHKLQMRQCYTPAECEAALPSRYVLFSPSRMFPDNYQEGHDWFCQWAFNASLRDPRHVKLLVDDELWQWSDARSIPRELRLCIQAGAEYGIRLVTATQEPHRVNSAIVGQCNELVCFRLQEPKAWDCVKALGADAERVKQLQPGEFVSYDRSTGAKCFAVPNGEGGWMEREF